MIVALIINIILLIVTTLLSWLPDALTLPTIGNVNIDTSFANGVGYVHYLGEIFPPLTTILTAAIIYLSFKVVMILLKVFLGSRAPNTHV
jgi:hypothetical protein